MGGLLSAFIGGAADAGSKILQQERELERQRLANDQIMERQSRLEQMREAAAEQRSRLAQQYKEEAEDRKRKQLIEDNAAAMQQAQELGTDRRYAKFRNDMRVAGYGEGMSEDDIRRLYQDQYDNQRVTDEAGGDRYVDKTRTEPASDYVSAARNTGNTSLMAHADTQYQQARIADNEDAKNRNASELNRIRDSRIDASLAASTARIEASDRAAQERARQADERSAREERKASAAQAQALINSLNAELKGLKPPETENAKLKWLKSDDGQRYTELRRQLDDARKQFSSASAYSGNVATRTSGAGDPPKGSGNVDQQDPQVALSEAEKQYQALLELQQKNPSSKNADILQSLENQIRNLKGSQSKEPKAQLNSLPSGAIQIGIEKGTGRPVYQTPDGKRFVKKL